MRLIDVDALMRIYQEVLCPHVSCVDCSLLMNDGNCRFETMIRETPAIDAAHIVRCRECKYRSKDGCPIIDANIWMDDDDFCSHGERKEGSD